MAADPLPDVRAASDLMHKTILPAAFALDEANFRLAVIDVRKRTILASIRTGRLPFAVALSPDRQTAYVTNLGMFEYRAIPGADAKRAK